MKQITNNTILLINNTEYTGCSVEINAEGANNNVWVNKGTVWINDNYEITEADSQSFFYHAKEGLVYINYIKGQSCICIAKNVDFFKGTLKKVIASSIPLKQVPLIQIQDQAQQLADTTDFIQSVIEVKVIEVNTNYKILGWK